MGLFIEKLKFEEENWNLNLYKVTGCKTLCKKYNCTLSKIYFILNLLN